MILNKKISFGLASAVLFSAATAFAEGESIETQQTSLLQKLDSLNAAVLGLKLNGSIKAGGLTSLATSDQFSSDSPTQENQANTDANLVLTARPSSETEVRLELRLHKDWQSAYDENNNPVIGHWFSYDGTILNKHLDFNLGYMRVGYTPYTLYTPQQTLLQEPEVFAQKRVEALAQRNLDTTSRRLMQGLNADYHSGKVGPLSDIHAQVTGARMRNAAKKTDQVFFDFDWTDRYFYGLRAGADAMGAHLGVNYTDVFDRVKSRRTRKIAASDTVYYEDNAILSAELGFDSKELMGSSTFSFGLNGEFAKSWWKIERDYLKKETEYGYSLEEYNSKSEPTLTNMTDTSFAYLKRSSSVKDVNQKEEVADEGGIAFYAQPYVNVNMAGIEASLKVMYLQNDEKFWSEMASSPAYRGGTVVLNSNALYSSDNHTDLLNAYGMSSLENMYFSIYNSNPLNATNLMTSYSKNVLTDNEESNYMYSRLFNNYKNSHFYRNAYNADVLKKSELIVNDYAKLFILDPTTDMALPMGIATPNRKGVNLNLDLSWKDAIEFNAIFGMISEVESNDEDKFTRYGAGLSVDLKRLANFGMGDRLRIQGSYDHSEESKGLKRKNDRIMAGFDANIYGPFYLLAGFQSSVREFGFGLPVTDLVNINKTEEMLTLVGPKVKIAPNSYISVQYGMLTNKVTFSAAQYALDESGERVVDDLTGMALKTDYVPDELSIFKNVILADVTVNF